MYTDDDGDDRVRHFRDGDEPSHSILSFGNPIAIDVVTSTESKRDSPSFFSISRVNIKNGTCILSLMYPRTEYSHRGFPDIACPRNSQRNNDNN